MNLQETVLGEVQDEPLSVSAIVRRVLQRHPLAGWPPDSIEFAARKVRREGLLQPLREPIGDGKDDPVPLELTDPGRDRLRRAQGRKPRPPAVRDDLLLQIAASDDADLPTLEATVTARIESIVGAVETADDHRAPPATRTMPWSERRMRVARALDVGVLDGMLRGLRQAHAEIAAARRHRPR